MWDTNELQEWAHKLGIGRATGIDLPVGTDGLLPTKQWRDQLFKEGETERPWSAGDNIQLAIGQGDLQTNPLQMAIAYAALGNGGTIVTPHVGMEVRGRRGAGAEGIRPADPPPDPHRPAYRSTILEGLHEAAQAPGGTSDPVFGGFPIPDRRQDGDGGTTGARRSVLVLQPRAVPEPPYRHRA